ncbi:ABC transporter permease [Nocardia mexicana]|uniref:Amino acid/amide ABC transporter membrane protein 1 (HAAT family) /amino acid/amide ABC transporter membrane protein 2 (HAAT family) n=1 Tax=Nocardia mexicana TaxID=279262 RepID=A0A370H7P4_9NOCA|nr:ABC transporter permease [Nocardia mexicana]RDI52151.1 amino acid/amide ABC transporter membrane protein 1 (HAAT family) /amino acid/amide ABC transporter membrane protein 2 (HAAT family) [Nocardia mexicana]
MFDTLVAGLVHGNAYALIAVGITLIFGVSNVINFAHGAIFAFGSVLGWWLIAEHGVPLWLAIILVVAATALLGVAIDVIAVHPLRRAPAIAALLATVAAGLIIENVVAIVFGPDTRPFPQVLPTNNFQIGGVRFGTSDLVMFGLTLSAMAGLWAFLRFSRFGLAIRATAQDPDAAVQMGIGVSRIQVLSFAIASGLGGLAGIFVGLYNSNISPTSGSIVGMTGFVAATVGGLGSLPGAVLGGFVLGTVEAFGIYWLGDGYRDLITFGLLVIFLVLRPGGLLARPPAIESEPMTGTFLGAGRELPVRWWHVVLVFAVAGIAIPLVADSYALSVGTQILAYAIIAVSMTLVAGAAGQLAIGQAGPIAIGAYTSAVLTVTYHWAFLPALLAAGVVAAVVSSVLAAPLWKLGGHYVAIATLGIGIVTVALIRNWEPVTQGSYGIFGIPAPSLFGYEFASQGAVFVLDLVLLAATLSVIVRIQRSRLGTAIRSVGADELAARASGIAARDYKALAFALAAFFSGIGGALLAHQYSYIDPTVFNLSMSLLVVTILVLGGTASPYGAVLGAVVLIGVPEALRLAPQARIVLYGVVLLLIIRFRPQGILVRRQRVPVTA